MMGLDLEETLIALCISALSNPAAHAAVERLNKLRGCEVHMTYIPTPGDEAGLRKLGVNLTSDPDFSTFLPTAPRLPAFSCVQGSGRRLTGTVRNPG